MNRLSKTETEVFEAEFDFSRRLESIWQPGRVYALNDYVRPRTPNGYEYKCTTGGQGRSTEPVWPVPAGQTVSDGSAVWTAEAFTDIATATISSVNMVSPAGITVAAPATVGSSVKVVISGGTAGVTYVVSCEITTSENEVIEEKLTVFINDE